MLIDPAKAVAVETGLDLHNGSSKICGAPYETTHLFSLGADLVVISAYGTSCQDQFLIPLERRGAKWVELNPVEIGAWYEEAKVNVASVVSDGQNELVVRGNLIDRGTGVYQTNMTIFRVIDGRLRVVFDEPEKIHVQTAGAAERQEDDVQSDFQLRAQISGETFHSIGETRHLKVNGLSAVEYRSWAWRPELQHFQQVEEGWAWWDTKHP